MQKKTSNLFIIAFVIIPLGYLVSWLMHYATIRKAMGLIPDELDEFSIDLVLQTTLWLWD
jgi:hypothetical protein